MNELITAAVILAACVFGAWGWGKLGSMGQDEETRQ